MRGSWLPTVAEAKHYDLKVRNLETSKGFDCADVFFSCGVATVVFIGGSKSSFQGLFLLRPRDWRTYSPVIIGYSAQNPPMSSTSPYGPQLRAQRMIDCKVVYLFLVCLLLTVTLKYA
jgi:hypothetical protein